MITARIAITKKCNRSCSYCCNEHETAVMKDAIRLAEDLSFITEVDSVVITGGEPMLYPDNVIELTRRIKSIKDVPVYVQTALWTKYTEKVLEAVDGISFSVHLETTDRDSFYLNMMQIEAEKFPEKSFRLTIHKDCKEKLSIIPSSWKRINFFHHLDHCPIPENEIFFMYE